MALRFVRRHQRALLDQTRIPLGRVLYLPQDLSAEEAEEVLDSVRTGARAITGAPRPRRTRPDALPRPLCLAPCSSRPECQHLRRWPEGSGSPGL